MNDSYDKYESYTDLWNTRMMEAYELGFDSHFFHPKYTELMARTHDDAPWTPSLGVELDAMLDSYIKYKEEDDFSDYDIFG